jgi:quercetin dioxygenase-like cupin family protein
MAIAQVSTPIRYQYDFDRLDRVPEGVLSARVTPRRFLSGDTATTGKSLSIGAVVAGKSLQVSLVHNARGTGSKLHTHPNEQFNYVLQGMLIADIDGQVFRVPVGHIIHIPAGMVHSHVSSPEGDVLFVAAKDTRHGIVGPPVDGKHDGPRTLPGFGQNNNNEWKIGANGLPDAQSPCQSGKLLNYVYDVAQIGSAAARGSWSGRITRRTDLSAMLAAPASTIAGEKLNVGIVRLAASPWQSTRTSSSEQFFMVLEGTLRAQIDGQALILPQNSGLHIPAGTPHMVFAGTSDGVLCMLVEGDGREN